MSENFTNASWIFKLNISKHARTGLLTHGSFIHSQMIQDIIKNNSNVLIEINKAKFEGKEIAKSQHLDTLSNSSCYWAVILGGKDECQIFPLVMPRNRLLFLLRSLQLDNITTRHTKIAG